jgi:hypothetical protein
MTRRDALLLAALACACAGETRRVEVERVPAPPTRERRSVLDLTPGASAIDTPLAHDPLWRRAAARDPIDLVRLADREGAAGLLSGLEVGRSIGLTALAALPYAEDGELALGRLCELATELDGAGRSALLVAIHGVVSALAPDRERLAGERLADCSRRLGSVAGDSRVPPGDRDLAESSRSALQPYLAPDRAP